MPKTDKIIGYTELFFAALAGIVSVELFKTAFFPSESTHWEAPGWALMNFILITPLALSLGVSGLAIVKDFKRKWLYHILPVVVIFGIVIFFWWADKGSMN